MTSNLDYKKYSLDKLQEWVHDALSCGEASPHEIYSAIREAAQEDYQCYKDHAARAFGLLELMSGHRPVENKDLFEAVVAERDYYEGVDKPTLKCDKDDSSPECKGAWYDFWENYYSEEYQGSTVSSVKQDKVTKWVLPVEADGPSGEYFVTFPDDLLDAADLKEGDSIEWVDQGNGSYLLKKVEKVEQPSWVEGNELAKTKTYQEMTDDGWSMTDDGFWIKE